MAAENKNWKESDRLFLKGEIPLDTPLSVGISVSTKCNFKCKYCMHSLPETQVSGNYFTKELMDMDFFLEIVEQLSAFPKRIKKIDLYGTGEPLLNPNLPEMVSVLKQRQICNDVDFITNGFLFTPRLSQKIVDAGADHIRISLQGLSSEMYKETCGVKIDFEKFVSQIKFLYENKKQAKIMLKIMSNCLTKQEQEAGLLYKIFGDIADTIAIENVLPLYGDVDYNEYVFSGDGKEQSRFGEQVEERDVCPIAFYRMIILPNGYVTPCCDPLKAIYWGNMHDKSLTDIWNGRERVDFLKRLLRKERRDFEPCKSCFVPKDISDVRDNLDDCTPDILE